MTTTLVSPVVTRGGFQRRQGYLIAERLVWLACVLLVLGVAVLPLATAINAAFYRETAFGLSGERSLAAVANVYFGSRYLQLLWSALVLATLVTAASLTTGVIMALLIARTDIRFKGVLDMLIITPLFLAPFTGMMAWVALGSRRSGFLNSAAAAFTDWLGLPAAPMLDIWSYGGVFWVMFLFFCPFAYLFTVGNLRAMDSSLEEAARTTGAGPFATLWRITLPMMAPAIFASGILIFVLAAELYTIPGMLGSPSGFVTLPWQIYRDSTETPARLAHAAAAGTLLLWITIIGVMVQRWITRRAERYITVSGKGFRNVALPIGRWRAVGYAFIAFYVGCAVILPFSALILFSFMKFSSATISLSILTTKHYTDLLSMQNMTTALWNSIWLAVASGAVCVLMGVFISFMEIRRPGPATRLLALVSILPVAVPGIVYGVGLMWVFLKTPLYGTTFVLLLAYVAKFLPYGITVSRSALLQIHPELEQSARMSGASSFTALRLITLPLLKPTLIAIFFFIMLMSIKELSASVLLYTQRSPVLSVLTWAYMDTGNYQLAAAIGVVQSVIMIGLVFITRAVFRVRIEKAISN